MKLLALTYRAPKRLSAPKAESKKPEQPKNPGSGADPVLPEDGPGAGGGYDGDEVEPLDDDGPGAGGGYDADEVPEDGPGAGGGYDGDDVEPLDDDGPGAGGGYDGDEEYVPVEEFQPLPYDGPGAGGGYFLTSTSGRVDSPIAVFSTFDYTSIPAANENRSWSN